MTLLDGSVMCLLGRHRKFYVSSGSLSLKSNAWLRVKGRNARHAWLFLFTFWWASIGAASENLPPAWFSESRPNAEARQAVKILELAHEDGLNADDYQTANLAQALTEASQGAPLSMTGQAALSRALTQALERFFADLHGGRVNPRDLHASFDLPSKRMNPAQYVRTAVATQTLPAAVNTARPQMPLYENLRRALNEYRLLEGNPALVNALPPLPANWIAPGQDYSGMNELVQRLIMLGDLPSDTQTGSRYQGSVVDGVKAFQARHGLTGDGIIGKRTYGQLNTPIADRIRQIELTLERLRWTPLMLSDRMIVVNVPEFVLRAYATKEGATRIRMNVIVGNALDRRTPLFVGELRLIEFSPYWNVPLPIAKNEIAPILARNPAYFAEQGFEFVRDDGVVFPVFSQTNLDAVVRGNMRIRQRPGPANALGNIKFVLPNNNNIYLHHTPAIKLFHRDRRDFSHGCIRLGDPMALAQFVLEEQPEWTKERIREAMDSGKSRTLRLNRPIPVVIAYGTVILKNDRKVYFYEDIYGNDKLLDLAIKKRKKSIRKEIAARGLLWTSSSQP